jgi:hypothetical protein
MATHFVHIISKREREREKNVEMGGGCSAGTVHTITCAMEEV